MTLEENKQLVRRYQETYNSNELDALPEVLAARLLTPKILPGLPPGLEGVRAAHEIMLRGFPDFHTTMDDLMAEGERVAARITMRGTHTGEFMGMAPTGKAVSLTGMYLVSIEAGKIVEHWGEEDSIGLMTQLGVMLQP